MNLNKCVQSPDLVKNTQTKGLTSNCDCYLELILYSAADFNPLTNSWLHLQLKNELYRKWAKQCLSSPGAVIEAQKSSQQRHFIYTWILVAELHNTVQPHEDRCKFRDKSANINTLSDQW